MLAKTDRAYPVFGHKSRSFALAVLVTLLACKTVIGVDEFEDLKFLTELPRTQRDIEAAHRRSRADACETIPAGESLELSSFRRALTARDAAESKKRLLVPSTRQRAFTVGLNMASSDRADLPIVSRGAIVDYLDEHFVDVQTRVRRDLLDRELYYHHRPLAVTGKFRGSRLSHDFEPIVASNIREFHSLGLFRPETSRIIKPSQLRTIVLLFKSQMISFGSRTKETYEFAFIRGRLDAGGEELVPHVFVTTEDRTQLSYLRPATSPTSSKRCSIYGGIVITEFSSSGIYPKSSAIREYRLDTKEQWEIADLDRYCESHSIEGGFAANVSFLLDLLIDGGSGL